MEALAKAPSGHVEKLLKECGPLLGVNRRGRLATLAMRLMETVVSLWTGNQYLLGRYQESKQENADLYRLLAALIEENGGYLRLNRATWERVTSERRVRGFSIEGTEDTLLQLTDQELVTSPAPKWIIPALRGEVPLRGPSDLLLEGDPQYAPVFEADDYMRRLTPMPRN